MPYGRTRTPIGSRKERIGFQTRLMESDGMGGQSEANAVGWRTRRSAWAAVTALDERTREALRAGGQVTAQAAYHMDIAFTTRLEPQVRVSWKNKVFEVHQAVPDVPNKRIILTVSEIQGAST